MRLIARGYAYKEIASRLFLSVKTVGDTRVGRAAQAPVVEPPPTHRLGQRTPPRVTG